jgi:hypothetical protein
MKVNYPTILAIIALSIFPLLAPPELVEIDEVKHRNEEIAADVGAFMKEQDLEKLFDYQRRWKKLNGQVRWKIVQIFRQKLESNKELPLHNLMDVHVLHRLFDGRMRDQGHGLYLKQDIIPGERQKRVDD